MNILVTGGAGFIGSTLVDALIDEGHRVCVVDNYVTGKKEYENIKAKYVALDVTSEGLHNVFSSFHPEVVYHLAAQVDVETSINNPLFDQDVNIAGCLNVLECCRKFEIKKIVYSSSAAVYGNPEYLPLDEKHSTSPRSFYGISKLTPELYIKTYSELFKIDYTILRYGNVFGPRQAYKGEAGVISIFINKALLGEQIFIHGDGKQTRDFIYVQDVVDANLAALTKGRRAILNISRNEFISLLELYEMIKEITSFKLEPLHISSREGDIKTSWLDNNLARNVLGWTPTVPIYGGLKETIKYYSVKLAQEESIV